MENTAPKKKYHTGITKALIANAKADNPLPLVDLADRLGTKAEYLYQLAVRLRKQGRYPKKDEDWRGRGSEPEEPPELLDKPPSEWDADDLAAIDKLPKLNAEQRMKILSAIGMRSSQGMAQASALKALDDMDRGSGQTVGPPPPLTESQQIERLGRLMRAVGQPTAQKAMEAAFGTGNQQNTEAEGQTGQVPTGSD